MATATVDITGTETGVISNLPAPQLPKEKAVTRISNEDFDKIANTRLIKLASEVDQYLAKGYSGDDFDSITAKNIEDESIFRKDLKFNMLSDVELRVLKNILQLSLLKKDSKGKDADAKYKKLLLKQYMTDYDSSNIAGISIRMATNMEEFEADRRNIATLREVAKDFNPFAPLA